MSVVMITIVIYFCVSRLAEVTSYVHIQTFESLSVGQAIERRVDAVDYLRNLAFRAVKMDTQEPVRLAEWKAKIVQRSKTGEASEREIPVVKCDFEKFSPVRASSASRVGTLMESDGFLCLDLSKDREFEFYGDFESDENQRLEIQLVPCDENKQGCLLPAFRDPTSGKLNEDALWASLGKLEV